MDSVLKCIAIDDDKLFLLKLETYLDEIDWITLEETFDNPIKGATAIMNIKPDLVFLDYEMPHVDGNYLVDWIQPKLKSMEKPPILILLSSVDTPPAELLNNVNGFINKFHIKEPQAFEQRLKEIIH